MSTSHTAHLMATAACSLALLAFMAPAQARTVSVWDSEGVAASGPGALPMGEINTGGNLPASNPVTTATGSDPYSLTAASASFVDRSVAGSNSSSCQTNKLVPCVTLTSYPRFWSCGCTGPRPPGGGAAEPGNLALLGIGLLGLLLVQARSKGRTA